MTTLFGILVQSQVRNTQKTELFHKRPADSASDASAKAASYRSEDHGLADDAFPAVRVRSEHLLYLPSERSSDFCNFASDNAPEPLIEQHQTASCPTNNLNKANTVVQ